MCKALNSLPPSAEIINNIKQQQLSRLLQARAYVSSGMALLGYVSFPTYFWSHLNIVVVEDVVVVVVVVIVVVVVVVVVAVF